MSRTKKIGILTLGQGINILVNMLFMPYMARALSYEENGTYGQVIFIVSFVVVLLSLGLPQIINVYLSDEKQSKNQTYSSSLISSIILGAIGFILLYFFSSSIGSFLKNDQFAPLIKIYSVSLLVQGAGIIINTYLVFEGKVKTSISLILISNLVKIALVTLSIQLYWSLEYAFIGIAISHFLYFALGILFTWKRITSRITKTHIFDQIKYGFPLGVTSIVAIGILYTDSLMVSKILGTKQFAIYRNGAMEVPFISSIFGSIAAIIMPEITKLWNKKEFLVLIDLKKKVIKNSIYLIYPILIFLLFKSNSIIVLYLGENYAESALIFTIFNFTLLLRINDYSDILIASKNGKAILFYYTITLILNALLNVLFIYFWGVIGAAISTVLCMFILSILQVRKTLKIVNIKIQELFDFNQILAVLLFSTLILFSLDFAFSFVKNEFVNLVLLSIIYFPIVYFFFLNKIDLPMKSTNNKFIKMILSLRMKENSN